MLGGVYISTSENYDFESRVSTLTPLLGPCSETIKETIKETTSGLFPASCSLSPIDLEVILLQLFSKQFLDFLPFL